MFLDHVVERGADDIAHDTANEEELVFREGDGVEVRHYSQHASNQGYDDLKVCVAVVLLETTLFEQIDYFFVERALQLERVVLVDRHSTDGFLLFG